MYILTAFRKYHATHNPDAFLYSIKWSNIDITDTLNGVFADVDSMYLYSDFIGVFSDSKFRLKSRLI